MTNAQKNSPMLKAAGLWAKTSRSRAGNTSPAGWAA